MGTDNKITINSELNPPAAIEAVGGNALTFKDGDGREIGLKDIIDHVNGPDGDDVLGVMEASMGEAPEYKVIEPSYAEEEGDPVEQLEAELNALGAEGWTLMAASSVRGCLQDGGGNVRVGESVPVLVMGRARDKG